jgi:sec-independent protein translocase protein TatA
MGLPNIGPLELIIILAIALLVVGPGRLPEMGNAIGRTIREFRKASSDLTDATSIEPEAKAAAGPAPSPTATPGGATEPDPPSAPAPAPAESDPKTDD